MNTDKNYFIGITPENTDTYFSEEMFQQMDEDTQETFSDADDKNLLSGPYIISLNVYKDSKLINGETANILALGLGIQMGDGIGMSITYHVYKGVTDAALDMYNALKESIPKEQLKPFLDTLKDNNTEIDE